MDENVVSADLVNNPVHAGHNLAVLVCPQGNQFRRDCAGLRKAGNGIDGFPDASIRLQPVLPGEVFQDVASEFFQVAFRRFEEMNARRFHARSNSSRSLNTSSALRKAPFSMAL